MAAVLTRDIIKTFGEVSAVDGITLSVAWNTLRPQRKGDILAHRVVRIEAVALKHHRDAAGAWRNIVDDVAVDHQIAACLRASACRARTRACPRAAAARRTALESRRQIARLGPRRLRGDGANSPSCCSVSRRLTMFSYFKWETAVSMAANCPSGDVLRVDVWARAFCRDASDPCDPVRAWASSRRQASSK